MTEVELKEDEIKIGEAQDGSGLIWSPFDIGHNKMMLLGDGDKFWRAFNNIEKQILGMEGLPYFKLNHNTPIESEKRDVLTRILFFEKEPENNIQNSILVSQRKDFVKMFTNTVLSDVGLDRKELQVSYRPTLEGPLYGYVKAIDKLEGAIKEEMQEYFSGLDNAQWNYNEKVFKYLVDPKEGNSEFLELLKGAWSLWVFFMEAPADIARVVHFNIPDTSSYSDMEVAFVNRLVQIFEELANMTNMVLVVTTKQIEHLKDNSIRYKLLVNNRGADFDFTDSPLEFDEGKGFVLIDEAFKRQMNGVLSE